ncbi:nuclear transport factor 2 family protein [Aureimonas sp. SA4125]|uniref:nuclear transport factor 2 family protein n=1 Tax=Aureimonas sp. SA4125 TaxID=2826993 RepID=UPI001CC497B2|nr:nuclear transport factor 2 family protein [Aureimonas sp. SA4125]
MIAATIFAGLSNGVFAGPLEDANKKIVVDFYTMAFRDHKPKEAADTYIGDVYIQHNPQVPNGPEPFYGFFEGYFKENPTASNEIKRVIAEGDLVVLHSHSRISPDVPGNAIVDIFRVHNGKIVEHWDVMQAVPAEPAPNGNTMFEGTNAD